MQIKLDTSDKYLKTAIEVLDILNNKFPNEDKNFDYLLKVCYCDSRCRGEPLFDINEWNLILNKIETLKNNYNNLNSSQSVKKVINGKLVMNIRKITVPSKEIGIIIQKTIDFVVDNNISLNDMDKIRDFILRIEV